MTFRFSFKSLITPEKKTLPKNVNMLNIITPFLYAQLCFDSFSHKKSLWLRLYSNQQFTVALKWLLSECYNTILSLEWMIGLSKTNQRLWLVFERGTLRVKNNSCNQDASLICMTSELITLITATLRFLALLQKVPSNQCAPFSFFFILPRFSFEPVHNSCSAVIERVSICTLYVVDTCVCNIPHVPIDMS